LVFSRLLTYLWFDFHKFDFCKKFLQQPLKSYLNVQRFANAPHSGKIRVELAPALETLYKLAAAEQSFDLVSIDAKKTEYVQYFKILIDDNLLSANRLICVDNTLLQGKFTCDHRSKSKMGRR
jgi:predicted O-methyltransferase YrrM